MVILLDRITPENAEEYFCVLVGWYMPAAEYMIPGPRAANFRTCHADHLDTTLEDANKWLARRGFEIVTTRVAGFVELSEWETHQQIFKEIRDEVMETWKEKHKALETGEVLDDGDDGSNDLQPSQWGMETTEQTEEGGHIPLFPDYL